MFGGELNAEVKRSLSDNQIGMNAVRLPCGIFSTALANPPLYLESW